MKCLKCNGRVFIDRQYTTVGHIEIYCIVCGKRKFFHPPDASKEGKWILAKEVYRAKTTMTPL